VTYISVYPLTYVYHIMKKIATTVKVENDLYDEFKILGVKGKVTLQSLVEKCVFRYVREVTFRTDIDAFSLPKLSTSGSFSAV